MIESMIDYGRAKRNDKCNSIYHRKYRFILSLLLRYVARAMIAIEASWRAQRTLHQANIERMGKYAWRSIYDDMLGVGTRSPVVNY